MHCFFSLFVTHYILMLHCFYTFHCHSLVFCWCAVAGSMHDNAQLLSHVHHIGEWQIPQKGSRF